MRIKSSHVWILGLTALAVFLGSVAYQGHFETQKNQAVAFVTVSLDQGKLLNESSSYEVQQAAEFFSDVVLGWTVEPSFKEDFDKVTGCGFSFTARRQERENLLFTVSGPVNDTVSAKELVDLIRERLTEYDVATKSGYTIALERESLVTATESNWRSSAGIALFVLLAEALVLWAYARRR